MMNRAEFDAFFGSKLDTSGKFFYRHEAVTETCDYVEKLLRRDPKEPEEEHRLMHSGKFSAAKTCFDARQGSWLLLDDANTLNMLKILNVFETRYESTNIAELIKREMLPMMEIVANALNRIPPTERFCPAGFVGRSKARGICCNKKCQDRVVWIVMNSTIMRSKIAKALSGKSASTVGRLPRECSYTAQFDAFLSLVELRDRYDGPSDYLLSKSTPYTPVHPNNAQQSTSTTQPQTDDSQRVTLAPKEEPASRRHRPRVVIIDSSSDDEELTVVPQNASASRRSPSISPSRPEEEATSEPKNQQPTQEELGEASPSLSKSVRISISPPPTSDVAPMALAIPPSVMENFRKQSPPRPPPLVRKPSSTENRGERQASSQSPSQTKPTEASRPPPSPGTNSLRKKMLNQSNSQAESSEPGASRKRKSEPEPEEARKRTTPSFNQFTNKCKVVHLGNGIARIHTAMLTSKVVVESVSLLMMDHKQREAIGLMVHFCCPHDDPSVRQRACAYVNRDIMKVYEVKAKLETLLFGEQEE